MLTEVDWMRETGEEVYLECFIRLFCPSQTLKGILIALGNRDDRDGWRETLEQDGRWRVSDFTGCRMRVVDSFSTTGDLTVRQAVRRNRRFRVMRMFGYVPVPIVTIEYCRL